MYELHLSSLHFSSCVYLEVTIISNTSRMATKQMMVYYYREGWVCQGQSLGIPPCGRATNFAMVTSVLVVWNAIAIVVHL